MKFFLFFLVLFVGVSHQQQLRLRNWLPQIYYPPYSRHYPLYSPPNYDLSNYIESSLDEYPQDFEEEFSEPHPQFRIGLNKGHVMPNRFILGTRRPISKLLFARTVTDTHTSYSFLVVTTTVPVIKSCVLLAQFSGGISTHPCSRRRRAAEIIDQLIEVPSNTSDQISPSQVVPAIEMSAKSSLFRAKPEPELLSSQSDVALDESDGLNSQRGVRQIFSRTVTAHTTVTSVITSYAFASSAVIKNFVLGANNALLCLPPGYTVC